MRNPFTQKKLPLGLDIGRHAIKAILLKKEDQRVLLQQFIYDDSGAFSESNAADAQDRLSALVEINELQRKPACSAVSDAEVLNFSFTIPQIPAEEMQLVVQNEIEQRLHYPIAEASFDYTLLPLNIDGQAKIQVVAYCARRDFIDGHLALLRKSKLEPLSVEGQIMASMGALEFNGYLPACEGAYAIVDFGQSHTTLGIVYSGQLIHSSRLESGTGNLFTLLASTLGISLEEADTRNEAQTLGGKPSNAAAGVADRLIEDFYSNLASQIQTLLTMFTEQAVASVIERVFLVGGGSQKKGLLEQLQKILKHKVEIPNPLRNIDIYNDDKVDGRIGQYGAHFAVAVGLALRGFDT